MMTRSGDRLGVFLAAAVLLPSLFTGCRESVGEIRIGVIAMIEGVNAKDGLAMVHAAELAAKQANAQGGIPAGGGRVRVVLLVEKDPNNPEGALEAARKLIAKDKVAALIGPQFSGTAIPVARLAENSRIVMIAPSSTNPETTAGKDYVFRIPFLDTIQGTVLARFARENLRAQRAAVLYDAAADYNRTLAEEFRRAFESGGGKVAAFEAYTTDRNADFSMQLRRISRAEPDVLFLPNYAADVRPQAVQARQLGVSAALLGGDAWESSFDALDAFDGSYYSTLWHPSLDTGPSRVFMTAYRNEYGGDPPPMAAVTYEAFSILLRAVEAAGSTDPTAVQRALHGLRGYEGVTGSIEYATGGDPRKSVLIVKIEGHGEKVHAVVAP